MKLNHEMVTELLRRFCDDYNEKNRRFWAYKRRELEAIRDMKLMKIERGEKV